MLIELDTRKKIALGVAGGLLLLGTGLLALSGGDDDATAAPTTTAPTTTTSTTIAPTTTTAPRFFAPLTGLPVTRPLTGPALIVKIDNAEMARPQAGLNEADLVYEEQVEGGVTRFAAVFHSHGAESLGPVRSGRTTDIAIASNFGRPLFAYSGANSGIQSMLRQANLLLVGYDQLTDAYHRDPDRRAPDNLFTSSALLLAGAEPNMAAPGPVFDYRKAAEALPATARVVAGVDYDFAGAATSPVTFRWDAARKGWVRTQDGTPHLDAADQPITVRNVVVQFCEYRNTGYTDVAGTPVPEAVLVGAGAGLILTDGKAVEATWSRPGATDRTTWTDAAGAPVRLTPGSTWIALVPSGHAALVPANSAVTATTAG